MNVRAKIFSILICVLAPTTVLANAGTPLVWAGGLHLLVGNCLIGLGEAWLLHQWFAADKTRAGWCMVIANYFSMIFGLAALAVIDEYTGLFDALLGDNPLRRGFWFVMLSYLAVYVVTVVLEWPFVFAALKGQLHQRQRSIRASVLIQACSYACLLPVYVLTSDLSLFTHTHITPPETFAKNPMSWVYFIEPKNGDVYRVRLNGAELERVKKAGIRNEQARLFAWRSKESGPYALWLHQDRRTKNARLCADIGNPVSVWPGDTNLDHIPDTWSNRYQPADLRPEEDRNWGVSGFFTGGLHVYRNRKYQYSVGLETPFLSWQMRNLILLPDEQTLFQLGDQIVLFDLNTRQIGLITMGRGPVVVLEPESPPQGTNSKSAR